MRSSHECLALFRELPAPSTSQSRTPRVVRILGIRTCRNSLKTNKTTPILIANLEPNYCARKSAQTVEVQGRRRRHCADEPAQRVEGQRMRGTRLGGFA